MISTLRTSPLMRRNGWRVLLSGVLVLGFGGVATRALAAPSCPAQLAWAPAAKIATLLTQDSGMPEFNPQKHLNQVTYVGRFLLVPQIGVVAGLPSRPPLIISGLNSPKVRIANRVHVVQWRMINASKQSAQLRVIAESTGGGAPRVVAQCTLPAPKQVKKEKRFAYLRWFWKPAKNGRYAYRIHVVGRQVSGSIERMNVPLRYGQ